MVTVGGQYDKLKFNLIKVENEQKKTLHLENTIELYKSQMITETNQLTSQPMYNKPIDQSVNNNQMRTSIDDNNQMRTSIDDILVDNDDDSEIEQVDNNNNIETSVQELAQKLQEARQ